MEGLEVGDIVLCVVDRIEKTNIFVKIKHRGKEIEGSIVISEIAPGRIRNLRDYVVPKKTIVCKILRISGDRIDLSLRRVTPKEKKDLLEQNKQERSYESILKKVLGEKYGDALSKIQEKESVYNFFQDAKENPKDLEKLLGKTDSKKILDILNTQKSKKALVKKEFSLKSFSPEGLKEIKEVLNIKDAKIRYISAGKYALELISDDVKKADTLAKELLESLQEKAKKAKMELEIKSKQ